MLLSTGADVTSKDHRGETALGVSKKKGHEEVVSILERAERKQRAKRVRGTKKAFKKRVAD